jgi:hypothetical protein
MSDNAKEKKQFKVVFNGTKKEVISSGTKFSKFINNLIRQYANVSLTIKKFF